jgi:uncharacterized protein YprB with RNaseH-like and TPR domain/predicted nuclease with RNAse H fold
VKILEKSLIHLPRVGRRTERLLWERGYSSWDRLERHLRNGGTAEGTLGKTRAPFVGRQLSLPLGSAEDTLPLGPQSLSAQWLNSLADARSALAVRDYGRLLSLLPTREHWRVLAEASEDGLYLDIETTGLSRELHALTVVGAFYRGRFHQWAWPDSLDELGALLTEAPVVITFNGARFDLPFLRHHAPWLPAPRSHIDLRHIATRAGYKGSQKVVEGNLGWKRQGGLDKVDGFQAIALWCRTLYGDRAAYELLRRYNRADVLMLKALTQRLAQEIAEQDGFIRPSRTARKIHIPRKVKNGHTTPNYSSVLEAWHKRRVTIHTLLDSMNANHDPPPVVVGIDLRTKVHNPTGWAVCRGSHSECAILYSDDEILAKTIAVKPDLISIDAPLSLPFGRSTVSDDDPARPTAGIVRVAERILWSRGIRVYPALIRHMQGLTARGIQLATRFREMGIPVIESYPGAAQDVLGIARKGVDETLLARGLRDFGFVFPKRVSHDELDALTSALVGFFYLADKYEGVGSESENFLIIPRAKTLAWGSSTTVQG